MKPVPPLPVPPLPVPPLPVGLQVWDASSGALVQKLPADLPVLDICPFEVNQDSYLASLTEKMLKIYKWE